MFRVFGAQIPLQPGLQVPCFARCFLGEPLLPGPSTSFGGQSHFPGVLLASGYFLPSEIVFPCAPRPRRPNHTLNHSHDKGLADSQGCFSLVLLPQLGTSFSSFARQTALPAPCWVLGALLSTLAATLPPSFFEEGLGLAGIAGHLQWDPLIVQDDMECLRVLVTSVTLRDVPQCQHPGRAASSSRGCSWGLWGVLAAVGLNIDSIPPRWCFQEVLRGTRGSVGMHCSAVWSLLHQAPLQPHLQVPREVEERVKALMRARGRVLSGTAPAHGPLAAVTTLPFRRAGCHLRSSATKAGVFPRAAGVWGYLGAGLTTHTAPDFPCPAEVPWSVRCLEKQQEAESGSLLTLSLNFCYFSLFFEVLSSFCTWNSLRMTEGVGGGGGGGSHSSCLSLPVPPNHAVEGHKALLLHTLSAVGVCS